jgi:hypothetical protein
MNDPWWVWMITVTGPVCLALGVWLNRRAENERDRTWVRTDGRVLGWHHGRQSETKKNSRPIVRFETSEGRSVRGMPRWAWDIGIYLQRRKPVPVWYDPADPEQFDARVWPLDRRWMLLILIGALLSMMFVAFPVFVWIIAL